MRVTRRRGITLTTGNTDDVNSSVILFAGPKGSICLQCSADSARPYMLYIISVLL